MSPPDIDPDVDPDIELDVELDAAPDTVRRALTDAAIVSQWLGPLDPAIQPANENGAVTWRWRDRANSAPAIDNEVVFEVTPRLGGGSRLRIAHTITRAWAPTACNDNPARWSLKWAA